MGRFQRPFGNLSVIILKNEMGLRAISILQGFKKVEPNPFFQYRGNLRFRYIRHSMETVQTTHLHR